MLIILSNLWTETGTLSFIPIFMELTKLKEDMVYLLVVMSLMLGEILMGKRCAESCVA